jgi:hypothetical protein
MLMVAQEQEHLVVGVVALDRRLLVWPPPQTHPWHFGNFDWAKKQKP